MVVCTVCRLLMPRDYSDSPSKLDNRQISLYVQRRIRVDVGHVFGVKTNPYLKIKFTFEIFHKPAAKL